MPTVCMYHPQTDSACALHRVIYPARYCQGALAPHGWELLPTDGLPDGHDVYYFHGLALPQSMLELGKHKRAGKKIVWSVDDDWLSIPPWNPADPGPLGLGAYELLKNLADLVVTSTPALARTFSDMGDRVLCAPNLLDLSAFPNPEVTEANGETYITIQPKLPVHVVWAGGPTHSGDLEVLTDVLDKLLDKFAPDKAVVSYFGAKPHARLLRKYLYRGLIHQPTVPLAAYQQFLNSIGPHVYLCPLAEIPFNASKSAIRVYEGWALCAAPVATDYGEYSCIRNGKDGRLVKSADSWESALHRMVTDHEFRVQCAAAGRGRVQEEFNWHNPDARKPWLKVWERITGVQL